jgi:hypothetical protein
MTTMADTLDKEPLPNNNISKSGRRELNQAMSTTLHLKPRAPAPNTLAAARLKVTTTLIPSELLSVSAPDGVPLATR